MSHYLIGDLERYGVSVRDRSEIAALHGCDGQLEAVTLRDGERLAFSYLFLFLGAVAVHRLARQTPSRGTSTASSSPAPRPGRPRRWRRRVPGVYAAGDVRSGSLKRCATAVGEGATVVRLVHERLTRALS